MFRATLVLASIFLSFSAHAFKDSKSIPSWLMSKAGSHKGHRSLQNHAFTERLRNNTFCLEQLTQLIVDRVHVADAMERIALPAFSPRQEDKEKIFYRSRAYRAELTHLPQGETVSPSEAARDYVAYLEKLNWESVSVHLWMFLAGETFGAQVMAGYFQASVPAMGVASRDFEGMRPIDALQEYNQYIKSVLGQYGPDESSMVEGFVDHEIEKGFDFTLQLFQAAEDTKKAPEDVLEKLIQESLKYLSRKSEFSFLKEVRFSPAI